MTTEKERCTVDAERGDSIFVVDGASVPSDETGSAGRVEADWGMVGLIEFEWCIIPRGKLTS